MENPIKMDDLGVPLFLETPMLLGIILFQETQKRISGDPANPQSWLQLGWGKLMESLDRLSILGKHIDRYTLGTWNIDTPLTWWPSIYKWLFQLDDEPNFYIGNGCLNISIHFKLVVCLNSSRHMDLGSCVASRVLIFSRMAERKCKSLTSPEMDGDESPMTALLVCAYPGCFFRKINTAIFWVVPPPSKSHHQDYYIFSRESL